MKVKKRHVRIGGLIAAFLFLVFIGNSIWLDVIVPAMGDVSNFSLLASAGFALLGGLVTFFTPCGLALLPAFLSYNLATVGEGRKDILGYLFRLGFFASLGMITFFAVLGALFYALGSVINTYLTSIQYVVAGLLVVLGALLFNGTTIVSRAYEDLRSAVHEKAVQNKGLRAYYVFGFAYGLDAIGCLFPLVFAVMISPLLAGNIIVGVTAAVAYSLGIALMLVIFTYGVAYGKEAITQVTDYAVIIRKIAGIGLIIGGIILLFYYGLYGMTI